MNPFTAPAAEELFGGHVPASVRPLLRRAACGPAHERTSLLWTAQALAPDCLPVYYALYRHHALRREFALATQAARRGLSEAAAQAGLPFDLRQVAPPLAVDFSRCGPARFWLFTLKALAFIQLRSGQRDAAHGLLCLLQACDPQARIGDDVVAALFWGSQPQPSA